VFSAVPSGHFGVGEAIYSRFTAPMREIVGIFCHKEALDRLLGRNETTQAEDEALRVDIIDAANRAKDVQRKLDREINLLVLEACSALSLPTAARSAGASGHDHGDLVFEAACAARVAGSRREGAAPRFGHALGGAWLDVQAKAPGSWCGAQGR